MIATLPKFAIRMVVSADMETVYVFYPEALKHGQMVAYIECAQREGIDSPHNPRLYIWWCDAMPTPRHVHAVSKKFLRYVQEGRIG